jgi:3-oxoacyl-[acyl-carrier protein] reductase
MAYSANLLAGKVAIVTGARRGIAKTIALDFAEAGADVTICDIITEDGKLDEVAKEIKKLGRDSLAVKVDISQKADIDNMVQKVIARFNKIDILVNCAAIWIPGKPLIECDEKSWDAVIDVDL